MGLEHKDLILGIKVRVGKSASGDSGDMPLHIALDVAEECGLPLMAHLDAPPPARHEVVPFLRKGDILTHCFRPFPNAPIAPDGRVREEILAARARGVVFDIGHGGGSFGFGTTRKMLAAGFLPDVISSDVHVISIEGPAFDLLTTMSKFLCLGVDLGTVVKLSTVNAAQAIARPDLGTLKPGSVGEAAILEMTEGRFDYTDRGILDRTHLRFFTFETIEELFARNGMVVEAVFKKVDAGVNIRVLNALLLGYLRHTLYLQYIVRARIKS